MKRFPLGTALWAGLLGLLASLPVAAGEARLDAFFDGLQSVHAEFKQTVLGPQGRVLDQSWGTMAVQQPGLFRLDYHRPHEQQYVGDGQRLWAYDQDLEQVTVREQESGLDDTPALLLAQPEAVRDTFSVHAIGARDGSEWVELRPRRGEGGFEFVRLGFRGDTLHIMELKDNFGQTTRLEFSQLQRNPRLDRALFQFEPPPGVDVVGDPGS
ncbi:outer membrane lipoprotein chaperone LolA [Ectothiorhodospiraceae bacterium 2226]|nr:outer membrane lipoprotein chaperone LolA [Ectothiorhodospiraceae bacterium 2226]